MAKDKNAGMPQRESRVLIESAVELARTLGIDKFVVEAKGARDIQTLQRLRTSEQIVWLHPGVPDLNVELNPGDGLVTLPDASLTRASRMTIGLFLAVLQGDVKLSERLLCLSGAEGRRRLDTLGITNLARDYRWFRERDVRAATASTRAFAKALDLVLRLSSEGREGRKIGTVLVLGNHDELRRHLRQLILNPLKGHAKATRNIHDPDFFETFRELCALDGAFIIDGEGVVESAATYLVAPARRVRVQAGLGARHHAAASLTAATHALAVVLSQSSGTVTVFHRGRAVLELEKPAPGAPG